VTKERKAKAPKVKSDTWTPQRWKKEFLNAIPWNDQQLAVFEEVQNSDDNLVVEAVAGAGKTTLIVGIVGLLPVNTKINILAYNVSVKEKLENDKRIPKRCNVSTAHGCCYGLLMSYFRGEAPKVDYKKALKLAEVGTRRLKSAIADYKYRLDNKQPFKGDYPVAPPQLPPEPDKAELVLDRWKGELQKLIDFARLNLAEATPEALEFTCGYYGIRFPGGKRGQAWGINSAIALLDDCYRQGVYEKVIDYADMLWLVHKLRLSPRKPKAEKAVLLGDEIQDNNPAMLSLYKKFKIAGYRLIGVGDPRQAITGSFMGARNDAMDTFARMTDARTLPLAETQRCPQSHVAFASLIVPAIKARDDAQVGHIEKLHPHKVRLLAQPGDLVICRFVAPLVKLCLETKFFEGKEGVVRGRNIAQEMSGFAKSIARHCKWSEFIDKLTEQRDFLVQQYIDGEQLQLADAVGDSYKCLEYCYEFLGKDARNLDEFLQAIAQAFPVEAEDRSKHIIFSSIHSAKGDEATNVFLVGANVLPYLRRDMLKWMFAQEVNATYVATTRSKSIMYWVPLARNEEEIQALMELPAVGMKLEYFEGYEGGEL
jgi:DNA helicase-2/ATP-dependent DNA helicase PcrA